MKSKLRELKLTNGNGSAPCSAVIDWTLLDPGNRIYLPQRKRFNLRQAIDKKEISAKFNLVKENEEQ